MIPGPRVAPGDDQIEGRLFDMTRSRLTALALSLAVTALTLAACQGGGSGKDEVSKKDIDDVARILADTAGGMNRATQPPPVLPANIEFTRDDIPNEGGYLQVTLGDVSDAEANKFMRRLKEERCTCGCPHTIDQCLIEDPQCDVAHRLANQVLREVQVGS
jgi:hypothetical protein